VTQWPTALEDWEGFELRSQSHIQVERGLIDHWLEAVQDANPLYWDQSKAQRLAGAIVAPPTMLSTWMLARRWLPERPLEFWDAHSANPSAGANRVPIEPHFALKEFLKLKEGIVSGNEQEFHEPVRLGDQLQAITKMTEIGPERTNRLGTGRPWTVQVSYFNQGDQLVAIERYRFFSYNRNK
jgi:uncharacterized protein